MRSLRSIAALAALLAAAACDSPTGSTPSESEVGFAYRLGTSTDWHDFQQSGNQPPGTELTTRGEWVHTLADGPRLNAFVVAQMRLGEAWADFWMLIPMLERGDTIDLQPTATQCPEGRRCTYAQLVLNPTSAGGTGTELCQVTNGRLVLRRVNVELASATFYGTGTCTGGPAPRTFEIRDGELDAVLPPVQTID
jgi:hypothetical protein